MVRGGRSSGGSTLAWLVAVLVLGAWAAPGPAQDQAEPQAEKEGRPRIEIEPKSLYVGEVFVGDQGKGEIKIRNTGTAVLKILHVRSSCGCTVAKLKEEDREIPPGGSTILPVAMKPSKVRQGDRFVKSLTILSNDPIQPALPVRVEARVKVGVDAIPYSLVFKKMQYGEVRTQELKLKSFTDEAFQITKIQQGTGPVMIEYDRELVAREHTVRVTVGPMPEPNNLHQRLRIYTTHSKTPRVDTPLLVEVEKLVTVSPSYLNLGRHDPGSTVKTKMTFSTKDDRVIESVDVRVTRFPMEVTAASVEASPDQWELVFKVPEELGGRKLISPMVMTTNIKEAGPIKVTMSLTINRPAGEPPAQE